jgi:hypothetical protein
MTPVLARKSEIFEFFKIERMEKRGTFIIALESQKRGGGDLRNPNNIQSPGVCGSQRNASRWDEPCGWRLEEHHPPRATITAVTTVSAI